MTIHAILSFPDPRLRTKAAAVTEFGSTSLQTLIDDMLETMYDANGIGLAATQINVHQQVVVMDLSEERDQPMVFINPSVTPLTTDTKPYQEGCLSVPDSYENVERVTKVRIQAQDPQGQAIDIEADELLAICIQHEIDHLQGILFVDHISALKRQRIKEKLLKQAKMEQRASKTKP